VIVRDTVIKRGGAIEVESGQNEGTTFAIRFPLLQVGSLPAVPGKKVREGKTPGAARP